MLVNLNNRLILNIDQIETVEYSVDLIKPETSNFPYLVTLSGGRIMRITNKEYNQLLCFVDKDL